MKGGSGDDIYFVDTENDVVIEKASNGNDTIKSYLGWSLLENTYIENLTLIGDDNTDGTGNSCKYFR